MVGGRSLSRGHYDARPPPPFSDDYGGTPGSAMAATRSAMKEPRYKSTAAGGAGGGVPHYLTPVRSSSRLRSASRGRYDGRGGGGGDYDYQQSSGARGGGGGGGGGSLSHSSPGSGERSDAYDEPRHYASSSYRPSSAARERFADERRDEFGRTGGDHHRDFGAGDGHSVGDHSAARARETLSRLRSGGTSSSSSRRPSPYERDGPPPSPYGGSRGDDRQTSPYDAERLESYVVKGLQDELDKRESEAAGLRRDMDEMRSSYEEEMASVRSKLVSTFKEDMQEMKTEWEDAYTRLREEGEASRLGLEKELAEINRAKNATEGESERIRQDLDRARKDLHARLAEEKARSKELMDGLRKLKEEDLERLRAMYEEHLESTKVAASNDGRGLYLYSFPVGYSKKNKPNMSRSPPRFILNKFFVVVAIQLAAIYQCGPTLWYIFESIDRNVNDRPLKQKVASSSPFDVDDDFDWEWLDAEKDIFCGTNKCLFREKKDDGADDDETAYLIAKNFRDDKRNDLELDAAWKLTEYLEATFHVKHLNLGPPLRALVTPEALVPLNSGVVAKVDWNGVNDTYKMKVDTEPRFVSERYAVVQKVRMAPNPSMEIRICVQSKDRGACSDNRWDIFTSFYEQRVVDKIRFISSFADDVKIAMDCLEDAPLLGMDFQFLVDGGGNIYFMDIDRAFISSNYHRNHTQSPRNFVQNYDDAVSLLRRLASWSAEQKRQQQERGPPELYSLNLNSDHTDQSDEGKRVRLSTFVERQPSDHRDGRAVLAEQLRKFDSLSCRAVELVSKFGKQEVGEVARPAQLMMVKLIQKVMRRGQYGEREGKDDAWNCNLPVLLPFWEAPIPVVFFSHARSGSSATLQTLGTLTGQETSTYFTTPEECTNFSRLEEVNKEEAADRLTWCLRSKQESFPYPSRFVGFKWNIYDSYSAENALPVWDLLAQLGIKVIWSISNPLDLIISHAKLRSIENIPSMCAKDVKECLELPTRNLLNRLESIRALDKKTDAFFHENHVKHFPTYYERLFSAGSTGTREWMRLLRHLEQVPGRNLTRAQLDDAIGHGATHLASHRQILSNYEEVERVLKGTEFQPLLRGEGFTGHAYEVTSSRVSYSQSAEQHRLYVRTVSAEMSKKSEPLSGEENGHSLYPRYAFDPQNIDFNRSAPCGAHKCFFASKKEPSVGFLVLRSDRKSGQNLQVQWNSSKYLRQMYNRTSFLLAPPSEHNISQDFASQLNSLSNRRGRYSGIHTVMVQAVRRAPKSSMLIGCHRNRQKGMMTSLATFMNSSTYSEQGGKQTFARNLRSGLKLAIAVMEEEPWFAQDWQAMLQQDGTLIDIDVSDPNRSSGESYLDWVDFCCESFEDILLRPFGLTDEPLCSTRLHSLRIANLHTSKPTFCRERSGGCLYETSENPRVAYLVANSTKAGTVLKYRAKIASWFTKEYQIQHDILGSPEQVDKKDLFGENGAAAGASSENDRLLVQKVKRFSSETVLLTCTDVTSFVKQIEDFRYSSNNLNRQVRKITQMTEERNKSLVPDFRAVLDKKGNIYLLDLHRILEDKNEDSRSEECLEAIVRWA